MPSGEPQQARAPRSLVARVAVGTALAAGGAGLVAALVSVVIAHRLVLDADDRRLLDSALLVATEIDDQVAPKDTTHAPTTLADAIAEEQAELAMASLQVAVYTGGVLRGGDARLALRGDPCSTRELEGATFRACHARSGSVDAVVGAARTPTSWPALLVASLLGAIVSAGAAAIAGRRAARWALAPLHALRDSLDQVVALDRGPKAIAGDDTVSEVALLRAALTDLVDRLGAATDSARRFSADAAHELRTPLTVIRGELELLLDTPLDPATRSTIASLESRVAALGALLDRLLALATSGDPNALASTAVALEDVAADVIAGLPHAKKARVRLSAEASGMILGDETLLVTMLENAIDNALKFSGDGWVDLLVVERSSEVLLEVSDDGPGLSATDRARAFEPFFRAASSRASQLPGHGVGLALVAQIARAHRGRAELLDARDRPHGLCLRVTLPAWKGHRPG